ncbi:LOW QUALITY PROTEIN: uncharacterized protein LOC109850529 [Asparagus officinalis]|uniref:LOW QUALITY PROTEIN: uncharacterized protein LOC109850529 n=1 Tax=Asparagus officinalis TaxID=4686 RepID=UPI00098E66F9|nr:LOW QUALITY PROTEIN: uncharacterized protein LOC109850529 [Asparagus officinalis]
MAPRMRTWAVRAKGKAVRPDPIVLSDDEEEEPTYASSQRSTQFPSPDKGVTPLIQPIAMAPVRQGSISPDPGSISPTNISHILFGILATSARTWPRRRPYAELWWRRGLARGHVWLDQAPYPRRSWPRTCPPHKISTVNTSKSGKLASASRIANIVVESYNLGLPATRYLQRSETEALVPLQRQNGLVACDYRCNPLQLVLFLETREWVCGPHMSCSRACALPGCPVLAHTLLSLHHLGHIKPINPRSTTQLDAVRSLVDASRFDQARILQQSFCYLQDPSFNWSVSVSWGYTIQLYPWILFPKDLEVPLQTFTTWRSVRTGPFTFSTREFRLDRPCKRLILFFLDRITYRKGNFGIIRTVTRYYKYEPEGSKGCDLPSFTAAIKVENVTVIAAKMDFNQRIKVLKTLYPLLAIFHDRLQEGNVAKLVEESEQRALRFRLEIATLGRSLHHLRNDHNKDPAITSKLQNYRVMVKSW